MSQTTFNAIDRFYQWLLIISLVGLSWLMMQVLHEAGHVVHLWMAGGILKEVILHPLTISQTKPLYNPNPLIFWWGGFVWGVLIPWIFFGIHWMVDRSSSYLSGFFAGFCLIANGSYLIGGAMSHVGDPGELMRLGTSQIVLVSVGFVLTSIGLYLWNGLGPAFGLGKDPMPVNRLVAVCCATGFLVIVILESAFSRFE